MAIPPWVQGSNLPAANAWRPCAFGNGRYVVVADLTPTQATAIVSSPDGVNWTASNVPVAGGWRAVGFANGIFVALSTQQTTQYSITSPDGINWENQTVTPNNGTATYWRDIAYGAGVWVGLSSTGNPSQVITSTDGINWTVRNTPVGQWMGIVYANGQFVAVGQTTNFCMTSPDGINWTLQPGMPSSTYMGVSYGNGIYLAVSSATTARSPDGVNWTAQATTGLTNFWRDIDFGDGQFVSVGNTATSVFSTADGINFANNPLPVTGGYGIVYGKPAAAPAGRFVAVCVNTTAIYYSTIPAPAQQPEAFSNLLA